MTTATAPRIIGRDDWRHMIDSGVLVVAAQHDFIDNSHTAGVRVLNSGTVSIFAGGPSEHATFYMTRDEARMFAQMIFDATE